MSRKGKLSRWSWSDELYDVTIVLMRGDGAEAFAWMDRQFGEVTEIAIGQFTGAKTIWIARPKGVALVLWFPSWFDVADGHHLGVLAHESFHAAEFLLRERGLTLTDSSDEAYAYYIAWIFRNVYKRLEE